MSLNLLSESEVDRFIDAALSREGADYVWPSPVNQYSGKDLEDAKFKRVYDCSGLVTSSLFEATGGRIDWRATKNASKLMESCTPVKTPRQGDLLFYGPGKNMVTHVAIYVGKTFRGQPLKGAVLSASGGTSSTLTPDEAKKIGARVRFHNNIKYRPDFLGAGRIAFE